jgi:protein-L-isoaspartate(D-aspartate) O-methyltransferase
VNDDEERLRLARRRMVADQLLARGLRDEPVLDAMGAVPRHRFMPPSLEPLAYSDSALGIGHGQTISQPYMVALMTSLLQLDASSRLLEIGTGSGYQAAVAGRLCREVWSMERVPELAARARELLADLGCTTVHVVDGDGSRGLPEQAPFDGILVTAATPEVPPSLFEQLADGGRLVAPVGHIHRVQTLTVFRRRGDRFERRAEVGCRFVPLIPGECQTPVGERAARADSTGTGR